MTVDDSFLSEEPNLPEKYTKAELSAWSEARNQQKPASTGQREVECDAYSILHDSEQHQQGISVFMKRCRRDIMANIPRPDITQTTSSRLPQYLQDIQRFNPELMNRTKTIEHCTIPTKAIIEDERRVMNEETAKAWNLGLVLRKTSNLIDPNWKREKEIKFVEKIQQKTKEKSAHVLMGVLQQWQKAQERSPVSLSSPVPKQELIEETKEEFAEKQASQDEVESNDTLKNKDSSCENVAKSKDLDLEDSILRHESR